MLGGHHLHPAGYHRHHPVEAVLAEDARKGEDVQYEREAMLPFPVLPWHKEQRPNSEKRRCGKAVEVSPETDEPSLVSHFQKEDFGILLKILGKHF